ncbi:hypothetical protein [Piscirickettsia litoralis]|uniref:Uncharacterized protein n=1 Tax=Piscirickettsia litoralis TaxID=1891921 RepID=A0ABX3A101_9GAMM|nr:hypothetical protein [Piscirickettsia litoralis]ODN42150.1 hypothetical protein BGC07_03320 [Piscirickettsia litoralis]
MFQLAGLSNIVIRQHPIYIDSRQPKILKSFYKNWLGMLEPVKEELLENEVISLDDIYQAEKEAERINEGDSLYQSLWVAEGIKQV